MSSTNILVRDAFANASPDLRDLYDALRTYLVKLGDDVEETWTKRWIAFRRIKNFACVVIRALSEQLLILM